MTYGPCGGVVVVDFPSGALDAASLRECAAVLRGVDAVLIGDAPQHSVQFPPSYRAALLQAAGATVWAGLNCRDRILTAADPRRAGGRTAVDLGRRMLDTGLVSGINLSGGPADGQELLYAAALAEAAEELRR